MPPSPPGAAASARTSSPEGTGAPTPPNDVSGIAEDDARLASWRREGFVSRATALVRVRLGAVALGAAIWLVPGWAAALGLGGRSLSLLLAALAAWTAACGLVLARASSERGQVPARALSMIALCLDALAAAWLISATGGLRSPLLALQAGVAGAGVWLFQRPAAAVPALLILPVVAQIDRLLGTSAGRLYDVLAISGQGALDLAIAYLLVESARREVRRHAQAIALERAEGELSVARERARLAREMHDGVGAALTGLTMEAELLMAKAPAGEADKAALSVRRGAEEALFELRRSLEVMRGDFDLAEATRAFCEAASRRSPVSVSFTDHGYPRGGLVPQVELTLFRIAQEAVSNALRHAGPTRVEVDLLPDALRVRDDGCGFDPSIEKRGHYGLRGMRERAQACGAALHLHSGPGATELRVGFGPDAGVP